MPLVLPQSSGAQPRSWPFSFLSYSAAAQPTVSVTSSPLASGHRLQTATTAAAAFPSPVSIATSPDMQQQQQPTLSGNVRRIEEPTAPIDESEWVFLLSEIIRQAKERTLPPTHLKSASEILFDYIRSSGIIPAWEDIVLPGGRSLRSYQYAYDQFPRSGPGAYFPIHPPLKRTYPLDSSAQYGRQLAPKPTIGPLAPTRMVPAGSIHHNPLSPLGGPHAPTEPRKKRGRPSKREQEERRLRLSESRIDASQLSLFQSSAGHASSVASAISTDVFPSPATPALLQAGVNLNTPRALSQAPSSGNSNSGGKKKRGRPVKNLEAAIPPLQFHSAQEGSEGISSPPRIAGSDIGREFDAPSKEQHGSASAPPELASRLGQPELEESKPPSGWKIILNE